MKHQITMCHKQEKFCFSISLVDSWRNVFLLVNTLRFHDGKLLTKALVATGSGENGSVKIINAELITTTASTL
jgi:hypothetical protein